MRCSGVCADAVMGAATSQTSVPPPAEQPSGFGVRMTPGLMQNAGVGKEAPTSGETAVSSDDLQRAFQQGAEYATQQLMQQQAGRESELREKHLEMLGDSNDRQEGLLRERIEALHKREYRPPVQPMGCTEERDAVLACYRSARGAPPGDVLSACQRSVSDLDKCSVLLREAAVAKVVPQSLSSL